MCDLTDGTLLNWPVSVLIERDAGGKAYGAHCCAYSGTNDECPPDEVREACDRITDACDGLTPAKALRKAISLGFTPDQATS